MANTLLQTAFLRPKLKSKKVANLYFTGQAYRAWPWSTACLNFWKISVRTYSLKM